MRYFKDIDNVEYHLSETVGRYWDFRTNAIVFEGRYETLSVTVRVIIKIAKFIAIGILLLSGTLSFGKASQKGQTFYCLCTFSDDSSESRNNFGWIRNEESSFRSIDHTICYLTKDECYIEEAEFRIGHLNGSSNKLRFPCQEVKAIHPYDVLGYKKLWTSYTKREVSNALELPSLCVLHPRSSKLVDVTLKQNYDEYDEYDETHSNQHEVSLKPDWQFEAKLDEDYGSLKMSFTHRKRLIQFKYAPLFEYRNWNDNAEYSVISHKGKNVFIRVDVQYSITESAIETVSDLYMFEIESDTPRFILVWRGFGGDDVGLCQPGSSSSYYDFQVKGNTLTIQYHSEDDYGGDKSSKTKKVATFPLNKNYDYYERRIANQVLHSREEFNSLNHILRNDLKSVIDLNQRKGRLESFLKRHTKENYIHPHIDKAKYELDRVEWRIRNIQEHINKWEHLDDEIKEWARVKRLVKQSGGAEHDVLHQFINDHPQHLFINDAKRLASSSTKDLLNRINAQDSLTWVVIKDQSPLSTTPPYMMSQTEITVAQYRYCVESNVCSEPISKSKCNWSIQGRENHPINCINWAQARTFAQWIGTHVDLPTSRTWLSVYSEQPNMTPFDFDKVAWYKANSTSTNEVGLKQKNKFGLYDMSGNVWEWLLDGYEDGGIPGCKTRCDLGSEGRETYAMVWHKDVWEWILDGYKNGKLPDCKTRCGSGSEAREIIGGGWYSDAKFLTGNRVRHHPSEQNAKLGFRLVKFLPR